ncbi:MAG TPA: ATP-binding protein, partial [Arenimonas sp.]|nr:ATP-binding protein [Arenimonas sp.]
LTDVREAVSEMRDTGAVDLSGALRTLVDGVPALHIRLQMPEPMCVGNSELAHVLLRCTQEIITNAVRHAGATTLDIELALGDGNIRLHARDDGQGSDAADPGNGLRGLRERVTALGGTVDIITGRGQGFALDIRLPLENAA